MIFFSFLFFFGAAAAVFQTFVGGDKSKLKYAVFNGSLGFAFMVLSTFGGKSTATQASAPSPSADPRGTLSQQQLWIVKGQEAVRAKLKDPSSAQFRNMFFSYVESAKAPVSCGEVNSKNSFGGYIGFQRYVSAGRSDLTFVEQEVQDFQNLWRELCKG
jgi:ascorbate-specific PTS system EIIC-type component UlaA